MAEAGVPSRPVAGPALALRVRQAVEKGSLTTALALVVHYVVFYFTGAPLWTETIGEWIMARTPNTWSVWILETFGPWAKPFALTGGLATLGGGAAAVALLPRKLQPAGAIAMALGYGWLFGYESRVGQLSFWAVLAFLMVWMVRPLASYSPGRRAALGTLMSGATVAVAVESFFREERMAKLAATPRKLWEFVPPPEKFAPGLVRKAVTAIGQHYTMSKNSTDPVLDPATYRLRITVDGQPVNELRYSQLLAAPRQNRYVTLRCISNTLKSDLMGTAEWSGFPLAQIFDRAKLPASIREVAFIGVDGHGDSLPVEYAFSDEVMLAVGMNGSTLNRAHGYPLRLLCPRYYGFKNVKWIGEIAFRTEPYFGTWPKMGYTKEALTKVASHIDKMRMVEGGLAVGGVSFAGSRGVQRVEIRGHFANGQKGDWVAVELEPTLSGYTWTRWVGRLPLAGGVQPEQVEARAQDATGAWQAEVESPLFPAGVGGPTLKKFIQR